MLSVNSSNVSDEFFAQLAAAFNGRLLSLADVDLSNNAKLTAAAVESLWSLTAGKENDWRLLGCQSLALLSQSEHHSSFSI